MAIKSNGLIIQKTSGLGFGLVKFIHILRLASDWRERPVTPLKWCGHQLMLGWLISKRIVNETSWKLVVIWIGMTERLLFFGLKTIYLNETMKKTPIFLAIGIIIFTVCYSVVH